MKKRISILLVLVFIMSATTTMAGEVTSRWDGSVQQVVHYLKVNLRDPGSLQFIEWSPLKRTEEGYGVRCKYRAKNSFGGYVVEEKLFILSFSGEVLGTVDWGIVGR